MKYKILYLVVVAAAVMTIVYPAARVQINTPYTAFTNWIPVIFIAALLASGLAGIYYMIGWMLNNNKVKSSALREFEQAVGSILLVVIIVGVLLMVGTTESSFSTILGDNGRSDVYRICATYLVPGLHDILGQQTLNNYVGVDRNLPDFLQSNKHVSNTYCGSNCPEPTTAVCQYLIGSEGPAGGSGSDQITQNIDYGLAATYVIVANMTSQSLGELNAIYNFESMIFFLRNVKLMIGECFPSPACLSPLSPPIQSAQLEYQPYFGYVLHRTVMPAITMQGTMTLYMLVLQLIIIIIILMFWPYLLAAGIILRTIPLTRRAGGLVISMTVVLVLVFPTLFLIEYSSLNNIGAQPYAGYSEAQGMALCGYGLVASPGNPLYQEPALYCYTSANELKISYIYKGLTPPVGLGAYMIKYNTDKLPACTATNPYNGEDPWSDKGPNCYVKKDLSLYVLPNDADMIRLYSCYPEDSYGSLNRAAGSGGDSILPLEIEIVGLELAKNAALPVTFIIGLISGQGLSWGLIGSALSGGTCLGHFQPANVIATITSLMNAYGIFTVAAFIIPVLNAMMLLSAMTGISSLMGGETTIIGLSRFL